MMKLLRCMVVFTLVGASVQAQSPPLWNEVNSSTIDTDHNVVEIGSGAGLVDVVVQSAPGTNSFKFKDQSVGPMWFLYNNDVRFYNTVTQVEVAKIDGQGRIGIGTVGTNPGADVHIKKDSPTIIMEDANGGHPPIITFKGNNRLIFQGDDVGGAKVFHFYSKYAATRTNSAKVRVFGPGSSLFSNWTEIKHDGVNGSITTDVGNILLNASGGTADVLLNGTGAGNVGIGTNAPASRLDVNGRITADEIRVEGDLGVHGKIEATEILVTMNPMPDYVFSEDYELTPLLELEAQISDLGHLPKIPSAEEVEANGGVDLGEMNRQLLEKVEELTLYLIGLKKEVAGLQAAHQGLQQENNDLSDRLSAREYPFLSRRVHRGR